MRGLLIDPTTGDLAVSGGTLALGETSDQVAESVLLAAPGEFKEYPLIGAHIAKLTNASTTTGAIWCDTAKDMLQAVGMPVKRVTIQDNQITIE